MEHVEQSATIWLRVQFEVQVGRQPTIIAALPTFIQMLPIRP